LLSKQRLEELGLEQKDLAMPAGVTSSYISQLLTHSPRICFPNLASSSYGPRGCSSLALYNRRHMSALPGPYAPSAKAKRHRFRDFWARVTEGMQLDVLGRQFLSEAKASYDLYSKDVDWEKVKRARGPGRIWATTLALFQAMLMKLSPARRVLLLLAICLILVQPDIRWGARMQASFHFGGIGVLILFVLLAVELADRVTMKRDLEIAREIQQWLVPESAPKIDGVDIAFSTRPQNTVAGDYYDAFLRPVMPQSASAPTLLIAVADVAGKSVPAALLMATFQASLQALAITPVPLDDIVDGLDRYCRAHSLEGRRFTTAFLAEIDTQTHEMNYVNAGHDDPILRRASGAIERLSTGGPPFGLPSLTDHLTPYESGTVQLRRGDLLLIFTDGVVEAVNDANEEYREERLLARIQSAPTESSDATLKRIMADLNAFVGPARQHDDITCLVLRITD
jgi:phosphoserine phosphatase RsbU/P